MTQNKINEIIDMLNTVNEYILSLPDDMLLSIDPRDNESLEQGLTFIKEFNDSSVDFSNAATKIEELIKHFFSINPEDDELEKESTDNNQQTRIIKDLDKTEPHTLDESFTYKRPYGFVLGKAAYKGLKTWRSLYVQTLTELKALDPVKFDQLTKEEKFISNRGNPLFSTSQNELRSAMDLGAGFYGEANLSANNIRDIIKSLLEHFGLNYMEMKIYFREDRDAQEASS